MWSVAVRTLRLRLTAFVATGLSIMLGAAIVIGCGGLMETGLRMSAEPRRLGGATLVVTGPQMSDSVALTERNRIDAALIAEVAAVPGVRTVAGDISFPAVVLRDGTPVTGPTTSAGHGWAGAALTPYALTAGAAPAGAGQVVLDRVPADAAGVGPGDTVQVTVRGTVRSFRVSGIATQVGSRNPDGALFFDDAEASRLAGVPGRIDSIGVVTDPGADVAAVAARVRSAVGDRADVLTGAQRGLAELPGTLASRRTMVILAAIFGISVVLIVMFGVASTVGLSLQQRSQEMALLRAVGATSRQLRRLILLETTVLAVGAVLLALVPGWFLGRLLFGVLTGSGVVSASIGYEAGWIPMAVGAAATLPAAAAATRFAGRRAVRVEPVAAPAAATRWCSVGRLFSALLLLAGGIGLGVATATVVEDGPTLAATAGPASVLFCIGLALLAPGITKAVVRLIHLPVRAVSGLSGYLALRNGASANVRMAGAVAPIVLLVGIATGTLYMQSTEDATSARSYRATILADQVLDSTNGGFAPGVADRVRRISGVAAASELITSHGTVDGHTDGNTMDLRGVSAEGAAQTLDLNPVAGELSALSGATVALPVTLAEEYGVGVGDPLPMHLGDGAALRPVVVALFTDNPQQQYLVLPAATLAPHTTAGLPRQILVTSQPGAEATVRAELARVAASLPGTEADASSALAGRTNQIQQILVSANYTIVAMIVGYAAMTVVNTLVAATRKRRREFALLRLTGATHRQTSGMVAVEGVLILVIAVTLGSLAALTTIVPYSLVKTGSWLPSGSIGSYLAILGGSALLIFGATLIPLWRGMRIPAVDAVQTV